MKSVGIIGGIAPESTIAYYRQIVARHLELAGAYPRIVINSIDLRMMLGFVSSGQRAELITFLVAEIEKLALAGADFGMLASNTPHLVFDEIQRSCALPLISIVEATARAAAARNFGRVALIGTRFTMRGGFYEEVFAKSGITVVVPDEADQDYVHAKYLGEVVGGRYTGEFVNGIFLDETRDGLVNVINRMARRHGIEAVILGGTELPLILDDERKAGIPLLDTTKIHVASVVAAMLT
jgi:aspartate racemase